MLSLQVSDIIQNVQNVLKAELSKPAAVLTSVPTIPGHANSEWSSILPSILSGESETVSVQEHDQTGGSKKPVDKPINTVLPDEKPMIQIQMITIDDNIPEEDQHIDKTNFEKVNTISTKPDQHGSQDQVAGASENFVKPVIVEEHVIKPEIINIYTYNSKNETVTVISEAHSTSMKITGHQEVQVHEETKPPSVAVEKPVDKKPQPTPEPEVIPSTIAPVLLNNELHVDKINVNDKVPAIINNDNQTTAVKEGVLISESPTTVIPEVITTEKSAEVTMIIKIDPTVVPILNISENNSSETPMTDKPDENLISTTVILSTTSKNLQSVPTTTPSPAKVTVPPQIANISDASSENPSSAIPDVDKSDVIPSLTTAAPQQPDIPEMKTDPPTVELNSSKTEIINTQVIVEEKTEDNPISLGETTSQPDEPLPSELTDALFSILNHISETQPPIISSTDVDTTTVPPFIDDVTDRIYVEINQPAENPAKEAETSVEQPPKPKEDEPTNVLDTTTQKFFEKIHEPVTETSKAPEVTESPPPTTILPKVEEPTTDKIELITSTEASKLPVESIQDGIESKTEDQEPEINTESPTSETIIPAELPEIIDILPSTEIPELKTTAEPIAAKEVTKSSEITTETNIIHIDLISTKPELIPNDGNVENNDQSTMVRIQPTNPLVTVHKTLESSPVQGSTPPIEPITMPPAENQSANGIGSGLIAGFTTTTSKSIIEESTTVGKTTEQQKIEEPTTTNAPSVTEKVSENIEDSENIAEELEKILESIPTSEEPQEIENSVEAKLPTSTTSPEVFTTGSLIEETEAITESIPSVVNKTIDRLEPALNSTLPINDKSKEEPEVITVSPTTISTEPSLVISINNGSEQAIPTILVEHQPCNPEKPNTTAQNITVESTEVSKTSSTEVPTPESTEAPFTDTTPTPAPLSPADTDEEKFQQNLVKDQKKDSSMEIIPAKSSEQPEKNPKQPDDMKNWALIPQPNEPKTGAQTPATTDVPETIQKQTVDEKPDAIELDLLTKGQQKSSPSLDTTVDDLQPDISYFVNLCNDLAFSFWKAVNSGLSNSRSLAVSPFGMTSMLAMIFLGARGPTSDQMNNLLKLDDVASFNPHLVFQNVTDSVGMAKNQGIANAAFVRELFADRVKVRKLMPFYKDQAQQFYDGIVAEVNFATISDIVRRRTNLSIRKQTGGRIRDLVKGNTVPLRSPLAAMSANVFQTDCSSPNATSEGRDGELYFAVSPAVRQRKLVPVPATLWKAGVLAGYEPSLDATAIGLGGVDNIVSTIFVVPGQPGVTAPGDNLDRLEERILDGAMHNGAWNKLLKVIIPRPGLELQVPKFSHRSVINATAALKTMGLQELFEKHADLKGMGVNGVGTDLHLADVLQVWTLNFLSN